MNRPFVRLCPCGCRMYGVWRQKWPETWEGDYPREGLIHFYAFLWEAMDTAVHEASTEGARRLREAMERHGVSTTPPTTTFPSWKRWAS